MVEERKNAGEGGLRVLCRPWYGVGSQSHDLIMADVLQVHFNNDGSPFEVYVKYVGSDDRLNAWVSLEQLQLVPDGARSPDENGAPGKEHARLVAKLQEFHTTSGEHAPNPRHTTRSVLKRQGTDVNELERAAQEAPNVSTHPHEQAHHDVHKIKNIHFIMYHEHQIPAWYFSPYSVPEGVDKLHVCHLCLKYFHSLYGYLCHRARAEMDKPCRPPGTLCYAELRGRLNEQMREPVQLHVYEIDGAERSAKVYCQCLCLLSRLFLQHKTTTFDVSSFVFYVLTEVTSEGPMLVGYFSKEKKSELNILACICVLPPFQTRGYGKFLIDLSYKIAKREGRVGGPERPLSDLGERSYMSYWTQQICRCIVAHKGNVTIAEISHQTSISVEDVQHVLASYKWSKYYKWGKEVDNTKLKEIEEQHQLQQKRPFMAVNPDRFVEKWRPIRCIEKPRPPHKKGQGQ